MEKAGPPGKVAALVGGKARGNELACLLVRGRTGQDPGGRGGPGTGIAASISESYIIFFIINTINSRMIC